MTRLNWLREPVNDGNVRFGFGRADRDRAFLSDPNGVSIRKFPEAGHEEVDDKLMQRGFGELFDQEAV